MKLENLKVGDVFKYKNDVCRLIGFDEAHFCVCDILASRVDEEWIVNHPSYYKVKHLYPSTEIEKGTFTSEHSFISENELLKPSKVQLLPWQLEQLIRNDVSKSFVTDTLNMKIYPGPMNGDTLKYPSFDAEDWAKAFMKNFGNKLDTIDEPLMLSWFACALMRGYDEAIAKTRLPIDNDDDISKEGIEFLSKEADKEYLQALENEANNNGIVFRSTPAW